MRGGIALAAFLGRRAADRFALVLDRLERSQAAQRQLVADASHELRTPVTALRTNAELLLEQEDLTPAQRRALLDDVVDQTEELTALVADLIELARGDQPADEVHDVRLDALVGEAVERARRHAPHVDVRRRRSSPRRVDGVPDRLGRAVNNLLDNAAKYSPAGGAVEVTQRGGAVTVRDHGPGVPDAELPHIFDRFFRATNAREQTGSGLGLAIVKQVAERHGGSVARGGGARRRPRGRRSRCRARGPSPGCPSPRADRTCVMLAPIAAAAATIAGCPLFPSGFSTNQRVDALPGRARLGRDRALDRRSTARSRPTSAPACGRAGRSASRTTS